MSGSVSTPSSVRGGANGAPPRLAGGLSLVELLITVTVLGLLATVAGFSIANTTRVAREQTALSRAEILDAARASYALSRGDAANAWTQTPQAQRFSLLTASGMLTAPPGYLSSPGGFELRLAGAVGDRTQVWFAGRELPR